MAIVALPWLALFELDFDRSAPLILFPPALWAGRQALARGFARFSLLPPLHRWLTVALVITTVIAVVLSSHRAASIVELARWVLIGLGAMLAGQLVSENPSRARLFLGAVALSAALGATQHYFKWQLGAPPESAFYPHHRLMGLHMLGGAVAGTAVFASGRGLAPGWILIGFVTWGGLFWTGSRAPLVGVGCAFIIWLIRAPHEVRRRLVSGIMVHACGGLLLSAWLSADRPGFGWWQGMQRTISATSAQQLTSNRSEFWQGALEHIKQSPYFGYGPDAYRFLVPKLEGAQPHNVLLQWTLDLGLFGGVLVVIVVGLAIVRGIHRMHINDSVAGWSAIAIASVVAGQLDGFFYHSVGLLAVAIAIGILVFESPTSIAAATPPRFASLWPGVAVGAISVLLLHTWLVHRITLGPSPPPQGRTVRLWYAFPSTTFGLQRWIDAWESTAPDDALLLARAAAAQSPNRDFFHVKAAGILLRRGDHLAAQRELVTALAVAPIARRELIAELQTRIDGASTNPAP